MLLSVIFENSSIIIWNISLVVMQGSIEVNFSKIYQRQLQVSENSAGVDPAVWDDSK